jgi:hypothetical protein
VEIKDVELPESMRRSMAAQAEASGYAAPKSFMPKANCRLPEID